MPDLQRLSTFLAALPDFIPGDDGPRVGPLRHAFFNNDIDAQPPEDARRLRTRLAQNGHP